MQSPEDRRKLAAIDRAWIEQAVRRLIDLRAAGNLSGMLDYIADDIQFLIRGNWIVFPYAEALRGKAAVAEALRNIGMQFENQGSTVNQMVIDGDRVAIWRTAHVRHRGTGLEADVEIADFVRFRDGLVVEFTEIADSVAFAPIDHG
jgi:ketosteroid isomerase-like protein